MENQPVRKFSLEEKNVILIIDDDEINREILAGIFSPHYEIVTVANGVQGLEAAQKYRRNLSAVLLDMMMPEMNGIQVLQELNKTDFISKIPVFMITAETSSTVMKEAYSLGVMDVINKPVIPYVVFRRIQSVVELFLARHRLSKVVKGQAEKINELNRGMLEALSTAIEFRSVESGEHVQRIHDITSYLLLHTSLGEGLSNDEIELISLASIMHDVGKIATPDAILNKPGKLTPEEFDVMKQHTVQGAKMLDNIPQLHENGAYEYAKDIALHHHERWDGRGYPEGLKGDEISVWAQIVSLADVYDALSCKRVYKDAFPREKVLEMIREGQCGIFNPRLLECFFEAEPELNKLYKKGEL